MGATAAVVVGSMFAGQVLQNALAPDIPNPGKPEKPNTLTPDQVDAEARKKQQQQRRVAASAGGREGTLLTGPQGLGELATENTQKKTLLGA